MNVLAVSTPGHSDWHWRIVDYDGKEVEESSAAFPTIAEALSEGRERLQRQVAREAAGARRHWRHGG
jgi:hypothetical protein